MDRALEFLSEIAAGCQRCPLADGRTQVVFGEGPPDARLMLVGEAPGAEEDRAGVPFKGRAGRALDALLREAGLDRAATYVTNAAMCRPMKRPAPTPAEVQACAPYLDLQLAVVRPTVIVAVGAIAAARLLGPGATVEGTRGRPWPRGRATVVVTWHPSGLNRGRGRRAETSADLRVAKEILEAQAAN